MIDKKNIQNKYTSLLFFSIFNLYKVNNKLDRNVFLRTIAFSLIINPISPVIRKIILNKQQTNLKL